MGVHIHSKFTIPFKGVVETRELNVFKGKKLTREEFELELRQDIGESEIHVTEFAVYPENHNFNANSFEHRPEG